MMRLSIFQAHTIFLSKQEAILLLAKFSFHTSSKTAYIPFSSSQISVYFCKTFPEAYKRNKYRMLCSIHYYHKGTKKGDYGLSHRFPTLSSLQRATLAPLASSNNGICFFLLYGQVCWVQKRTWTEHNFWTSLWFTSLFTAYSCGERNMFF